MQTRRTASLWKSKSAKKTDTIDRRCCQLNVMNEGGVGEDDSPMDIRYSRDLAEPCAFNIQRVADGTFQPSATYLHEMLYSPMNEAIHVSKGTKLKFSNPAIQGTHGEEHWGSGSCGERSSARKRIERNHGF